MVRKTIRKRKMVRKAIPDYPRGITFEQVWAALMEDREEMKQLRESQKEYQKETERILKENAERSQKEAERSQKEAERSQKETAEWKREVERMIKEGRKQMGELHNRFGELAEHLVAPGIVRRFNELGYHIDACDCNKYGPHSGKNLFDEKGMIVGQIDVFLENAEFIIGVEVKSMPKEQDIKEHIERLKILRENRARQGDKNKKIYGAIAGAIFPQAVRVAAIKAGFFVLVQSGDTMKIEVPQGFLPSEW